MLPVLGKKNYIAWGLLISFMFSLFFGIIVIFYDNTVCLTGNGLWRVKQIEKWIKNSPSKVPEPSKVLYLPVTGLFARWMPFKNDMQIILKKMTIVNALFGGLAVGFTFLLIYELTLHLGVSILGAIFQAGCAFFLFLATTNEDIMPGYAFFVAAVLFTVIFAQQRKYSWLFTFTQMYVISWLFHWSLIFAGPAFLLAIFMLPGTLCQRCKDSLRFLYLCTLIPLLIAVIGAFYIIYHPLHILSYIFFPRYGTGTGWGGFSVAKIWYAFNGIGQYIFGGRNISDFKTIFQPFFLITNITSWILILILAYIFVIKIKSNWQKPQWRTTGLVLVGTFVMAQLLNLYSQPQDPQMQLQPMAWLAVAFGIFASLFQKRYFKKFIFLSLIPLMFNLSLFFPTCGNDSRNISQLKKLESVTDSTNTFFVTHGWDQLTQWSLAMWEPQQRHIIMLCDILIRCPKNTPEESSTIIFSQIQQAFKSRYRVVIGPVWDMTEEDFISTLLTVSKPEKTRAIYRMLKERFEATPLVDTDWGCFYELRYKKRRHNNDTAK